MGSSPGYLWGSKHLEPSGCTRNYPRLSRRWNIWIHGDTAWLEGMGDVGLKEWIKESQRHHLAASVLLFRRKQQDFFSLEFQVSPDFPVSVTGWFWFVGSDFPHSTFRSLGICSGWISPVLIQRELMGAGNAHSLGIRAHIQRWGFISADNKIPGGLKPIWTLWELSQRGEELLLLKAGGSKPFCWTLCPNLSHQTRAIP